MWKPFYSHNDSLIAEREGHATCTTVINMWNSEHQTYELTEVVLLCGGIRNGSFPGSLLILESVSDPLLATWSVVISNCNKLRREGLHLLSVINDSSIITNSNQSYCIAIITGGNSDEYAYYNDIIEIWHSIDNATPDFLDNSVSESSIYSSDSEYSNASTKIRINTKLGTFFLHHTTSCGSVPSPRTYAAIAPINNIYNNFIFCLHGGLMDTDDKSNAFGNNGIYICTRTCRNNTKTYSFSTNCIYNWQVYNPSPCKIVKLVHRSHHKMCLLHTIKTKDSLNIEKVDEYSLLMTGGCTYDPNNQLRSFNECWIIKITEKYYQSYLLDISSIYVNNTISTGSNFYFPRLNGHIMIDISTVTTPKSNIELNNDNTIKIEDFSKIFFIAGGKDTSEGKDDIYILEIFKRSSVYYGKLSIYPPPRVINFDNGKVYAGHVEREVPTPHWRYLSTAVLCNTSNIPSIITFKHTVLLIAGQCRHPDNNISYYHVINSNTH